MPSISKTVSIGCYDDSAKLFSSTYPAYSPCHQFRKLHHLWQVVINEQNIVSPRSIVSCLWLTSYCYRCLEEHILVQSVFKKSFSIESNISSPVLLTAGNGLFCNMQDRI